MTKFEKPGSVDWDYPDVNKNEDFIVALLYAHCALKFLFSLFLFIVDG